MLQYLTPDILLFFAGQRVGYVIGKDPFINYFGSGRHRFIVATVVYEQIFIRFSSPMHAIKLKGLSILTHK